MKIRIEYEDGYVREFTTTNEPQDDEVVEIITKHPRTGEEVFEVGFYPETRGTTH